MRNVREIHTEEPLNEMWSHIGYFESEFNAKEFLQKRFPNLANEKLQEKVLYLAHSTSQAREFYQTANQVSLVTQPLLLFYGMVSLANALITATLEENQVTKHGLRIDMTPTNFEDMNVIVGEKGRFPSFHSCFCKEKVAKGTNFSVKELISIIPELKESYEQIYKQNSRAIKIRRETFRPGVKCVRMVESPAKTFGADFLSRIPGLEKKYILKDAVDNNGNVTLWQYHGGQDEEDVLIKTVLGEEFFVVPLQKDGNNVYLPELSMHFLLMYALGMMARYEPKKWLKIVKAEETGTIYIVRKFLETSKRKFPNLILNELWLEIFNFSSSKVSEPSGKELTEMQLEQAYEYVSRKMGEELRRYL